MRLIDAHALAESIGIPIPDGNGMYTEEQEDFLYNGVVMFLYELAREINDAPTVGATPVVRCKNCTHYHKGEQGWYCDTLVFGSNGIQDEFYCANGEENEHD